MRLSWRPRTSLVAELAGPPDGLSRLPGIFNLEVDGTRVRCQVNTSEFDGVLGYLTSVGVRSLVSQPPTLEELFLQHYETDTAGETDPHRARTPTSP